MATLRWLDGLNGDFGTVTNWSPGLRPCCRVPGATDAAIIAAVGVCTVTITTADVVGSLVINDTGATVIDQLGGLATASLSTYTGTSLTNNGTMLGVGGIGVNPAVIVDDGVFNLGGYNTYLAIIGTCSGAPAVGAAGAGSINLIGGLNQLRLMG